MMEMPLNGMIPTATVSVIIGTILLGMNLGLMGNSFQEQLSLIVVLMFTLSSYILTLKDV